MLALFPLVLAITKQLFAVTQEEYVSFLNTHFLPNLKTTVKHLFL